MTNRNYFFILFLLMAFSSYAQEWKERLESDLKAPVFKPDTFNILHFGAKPGDLKINNSAFQKAITACAENGGGVVLVPAGKWLSGPIHFKSNVNLHLAEGAEISFSKKFDDYLPVVLIQRGGYYCYNYSPPVYARDCQNIAITGKGTLNGNGQVWWPWKKNQPGMVELFKMGKARVPVEERVFGTPEDGVRPPFVQFIRCENVLVEDVTLLNGPSWNLHPVQSKNIIIRGITIEAHGPNNDGIDPDGCENVLIENCTLNVGDDNIALKSGRDEEAWEIGTTCRNVIVRNCTSLRGHGGFVIGSEMSAGVENVWVENCRFENTDRGIRIKTRYGRGGFVRNVNIQNIQMTNIEKEAIVINMKYDGEPIEKNIKFSQSDKAMPMISDISISNVQCEGAEHAIRLIG
ncbi:MAG: glycoside hydrolase family 28 protein, partial [Candidatus Cyclobacteriaceae bacterium M3_2C_046]